MIDCLITCIICTAQLRSAATGTLLVARARTTTGQRIFAVNGLATWNRLPPAIALRSPDLSESAFKRALKTHLFSTAPAASLRRLHDSGTGYKYSDLHTCLLTYNCSLLSAGDYWLSALLFLSASLYFSKRGAYWDRLCRDVVGRWLVGCHARALWPNGAF